ncbi:MAG: glycosyltransferase family 4 protein [Chloroflexota bacterium]
MRILLVTNGFPPSAYGGVEIYTADLARELRARGHRLLVACRESNPVLADGTALQDSGGPYPVHRIVNDFKQARGLADTLLNPVVEAWFERLLDEFQPQLVHFQHLIALSAGLPELVRRRGLPYVISLHDYWPLCDRVQLVNWRGQACPGPLHDVDCPACIAGGPPVHRLYIRLRGLLRGERQGSLRAPAAASIRRRNQLLQGVLLGAQRILAGSVSVREQYRRNGCPADAITVIPLGLPLPKPLPARRAPRRPLQLGFIGSLIHIKGAHLLLKALQQTPNLPVQLTLYGRLDIPPLSYPRYLQRLAAHDPRVRFAGPFQPEQRAAVYDSLDLLVIPSLAPETFSFAAREALVYRKPVLAARIGALPEVVLPGQNGFLFEPGDVPGLAALIERLAADPGLLEPLQLPGPLPLLTTAQHAERVEDVYRQALAAAG